MGGERSARERAGVPEGAPEGEPRQGQEHEGEGD